MSLISFMLLAIFFYSAPYYYEQTSGFRRPNKVDISKTNNIKKWKRVFILNIGKIRLISGVVSALSLEFFLSKNLHIAGHIFWGAIFLTSLVMSIATLAWRGLMRGE